MNSIIIIPSYIDFNQYNYKSTKQFIIKGSGSDEITEPLQNITITLNVINIGTKSDPDWL